jgi:4-hydroxy-tetrahydrodipicolinate reductase
MSISIGINGAKGKMGKVLRKAILKDTETFLVYAHDPKLEGTDVDTLCQTSDVVIDFSSSKGCDELLCAALSNDKSRLIVCTTGLSNKQMQELENAALQIPILYAANTSIGASLVTKLSYIASQILGNKEFDAEIVDIHHKSKKDAPSGTALMIEESINLGFNTHKSETPSKVHFSSIRGGQVVGEHKIMFLGNQEEIIISHKVTDRYPFAKGALRAAKWLINQAPGKLYKIEDII